VASSAGKNDSIELGHRDVDRGAERGDGAEERELGGAHPQHERDEQLGSRVERCDRLVADAGVAPQLVVQHHELGIGRRHGLAVQSFEQVGAVLAEVDDAGSEAIGVQAHAQGVHRGNEERRVDTVGEDRHRRPVRRDEVPGRRPPLRIRS
jgi:hypothetical protein